MVLEKLFFERYSSQIENTKADISEIKKLKDGKANSLAIQCRTESEFSLETVSSSSVLRNIYPNARSEGLAPSYQAQSRSREGTPAIQPFRISPHLHGLSARSGRDESEINSLGTFVSLIARKQADRKKKRRYMHRNAIGSEHVKLVLDQAFCDSQMFDDDFSSSFRSICVYTGG